MSHKQHRRFLSLQVTTVFCIDQALTMTPTARNFSVFFFANLRRTTEITWSIFSLLKFNKYNKIIMHSETSFGSFKVSAKCSNLLFLLSKFLLCCPNSSTFFFNKLNSNFLNIDNLTHINKFPFNICWFVVLQFFCCFLMWNRRR